MDRDDYLDAVYESHQEQSWDDFLGKYGRYPWEPEPDYEIVHESDKPIVLRTTRWHVAGIVWLYFLAFLAGWRLLALTKERLYARRHTNVSGETVAMGANSRRVE